MGRNAGADVGQVDSLMLSWSSPLVAQGTSGATERSQGSDHETQATVRCLLVAPDLDHCLA